MAHEDEPRRKPHAGGKRNPAPSASGHRPGSALGDDAFDDRSDRLAVIAYIADMTSEFAGLAQRRRFMTLASLLDAANLRASEDLRTMAAGDRAAR